MSYYGKIVGVLKLTMNQEANWDMTEEKDNNSLDVTAADAALLSAFTLGSGSL